MHTPRTTLKLASIALLIAGAARADTVAFVHAGSIYGDEKKAPLRDPDGVGCSEAGALVVADSGNGRLVRYAYKDGQLSGGTEVRAAQLTYPTRVQIDGKGNLFVLDRKARRIARLDPSGRFQSFVEAKGAKAPVVPGAFKLDRADNLYVQDLGSHSILVLDPSGNVTRKLDLPGEARSVTDIAVDPAGSVFVVDGGMAVVWVAEKGTGPFKAITKSMREYLSFPGYITPARGRLFVVDQNGHGLVTLGADGSFQGRQLGMGWNDGLLYYPSQLCFTDAGVAFVADRSNHRVQIFKTGK